MITKRGSPGRTINGRRGRRLADDYRRRSDFVGPSCSNRCRFSIFTSRVKLLLLLRRRTRVTATTAGSVFTSVICCYTTICIGFSLILRGFYAQSLRELKFYDGGRARCP